MTYTAGSYWLKNSCFPILSCQMKFLVLLTLLESIWIHGYNIFSDFCTMNSYTSSLSVVDRKMQRKIEILKCFQLPLGFFLFPVNFLSWKHFGHSRKKNEWQNSTSRCVVNTFRLLLTPIIITCNIYVQKLGTYCSRGAACILKKREGFYIPELVLTFLILELQL